MVKLMQEYLLVNSKLLFIALQVFTKVKWYSVTLTPLALKKPQRFSYLKCTIFMPASLRTPP